MPRSVPRNLPQINIMATSLAPSPQLTRSTRGVHAWAWTTLSFFVFVVLEGAVVRITGSGAGCGDHWPLCNGEVLPHHPRLATIIEFAHRSLTGISTAMFALLIGWVFRATRKGHSARRAAVIAGILLLTEAALGAVLVLGHYVEKNASAARVLVQGVHFTNTLLLLAATTVTAVLLRTVRTRTAGKGDLSATPLWLALAATIVVGATGSVAALADTIYPSPSLSAAIAADFAASSPLLIRMRWIHPAASALLVVACVWLALTFIRARQRAASRLVLINLLVQVVTGVMNVLLLAPAWLQVLHLLGADVFWITLVALAVPVLLPRLAMRRSHAQS